MRGEQLKLIGGAPKCVAEVHSWRRAWRDRLQSPSRIFSYVECINFCNPSIPNKHSAQEKKENNNASRFFSLHPMIFRSLSLHRQRWPLAAISAFKIRACRCPTAQPFTQPADSQLQSQPHSQLSTGWRAVMIASRCHRSRRTRTRSSAPHRSATFRDAVRTVGRSGSCTAVGE